MKKTKKTRRAEAKPASIRTALNEIAATVKHLDKIALAIHRSLFIKRDETEAGVENAAETKGAN